MRSFLAPVILCVTLVNAAPAPQQPVNDLLNSVQQNTGAEPAPVSVNTQHSDLDLTTPTQTTAAAQQTFTEPSSPTFVFVEPTTTAATTAPVSPAENIAAADHAVTTASPTFQFAPTDSVTTPSSPTFTFAGTDAAPTASAPTVSAPAVTAAAVNEPTVDHVPSVPTTTVLPDTTAPSFTYTGTDIPTTIANEIATTVATDVPTTIDTASIHATATVSVSASASVQASVDTTAITAATGAVADTLTAAQAVTTAAAATSPFAFVPTTTEAATSTAVPIVPVVAGTAAHETIVPTAVVPTAAVPTIAATTPLVVPTVQPTLAGEGSAQPTVPTSAASINIAPVAPVTTAAGTVVADHTAAPSNFVIGSQTVSVGQAINIGSTLAMIQTTGGKTELWIGDKTSDLSFTATAAPTGAAPAITSPAAYPATATKSAGDTIQINSNGNLVLGSVTLVPGETFTQTGANHLAQTVAVHTSDGKTQLVIADASGTRTQGLQVATVVPVPEDQAKSTITGTASADAPAQTTVNGQVYHIGGATLGGAAGTLKTTGVGANGASATGAPGSGPLAQTGAAAASQVSWMGAMVMGAFIGAFAMI
jgi:hypothetical protein